MVSSAYKVGFVIRRGGVLGGDLVQAQRTAEALERLGVAVQRIQDPSEIGRVNLVHAFNIWRPQEAYAVAKACNQAGVPLVLSPIFWRDGEYEREGSSAMRRFTSGMMGEEGSARLKLIAKGVMEGDLLGLKVGLRGIRRTQAETIGLASALLPNSESEMEQLSKWLSISEFPKHFVVPNGVDASWPLNGGEERSSDDVVCVARIEPRKNLARLAMACQKIGVRLRIVGPIARHHHAYGRELERRFGSGIDLVGPIDHEHIPDLLSQYKVHALVSWFETPGLANLEAAAAGCSLVVSDRGSVREYFDELVEYVDPQSVNSIALGLTKALSAPRVTTLREIVIAKYNWDRIARLTDQAYRTILEQETENG